MGWPGRPVTGCPGRPGAPGRCGNLDGGPPGLWLVEGRGGAGGFTRAPGGSGFQLGFGGALTGATGRAVADFAPACAAGEVGCRGAPCGFNPAGAWGAAGLDIAGGEAGGRASGLGVASGGATCAGLEITGGMDAGFAGTAAGAAGFISTGAGVGGATATGSTATGADCTGTTGACGAGGAGATTPAGFIRAARAAASLAALSDAAFSSAATSASAMSRKCLRTTSAAATSIELECVFFSVTPASGKYSIIAFALTSSSRASSLIRI
jgi:hypothetical protein